MQGGRYVPGLERRVGNEDLARLGSWQPGLLAVADEGFQVGQNIAPRAECESEGSTYWWDGVAPPDGPLPSKLKGMVEGVTTVRMGKGISIPSAR